MKRHLPFGLVAAAFLGLRFVSVGSFAREHEIVGLGAALGSSETRLRYLLVPFEAVVRRTPLSPGVALVTALVLATLVMLLVVLARAPGAAYARRLVLFFGVLWPALTFLPLLVTYVSPRHLYLPLAGAAVGLGALFFPAAAGGARGGVFRTGLAALLLVVQAVTSFSGAQAWAEAGRTSRDVQQQLAQALGARPSGETVVMTALPAMQGRSVFLWTFALPFALERPFLPVDLYDAYRVLESPDVYCCTPAVWWERKKPLLASLTEGPGDEQVQMSAVNWDPASRTIGLRVGHPTRAMLREAVERALGGPLASAPVPTPGRANVLLRGLSVAVREASGSQDRP